MTLMFNVPFKSLHTLMQLLRNWAKCSHNLSHVIINYNSTHDHYVATYDCFDEASDHYYNARILHLSKCDVDKYQQYRERIQQLYV